MAHRHHIPPPSLLCLLTTLLSVATSAVEAFRSCRCRCRCARPSPSLPFPLLPFPSLSDVFNDHVINEPDCKRITALCSTSPGKETQTRRKRRRKSFGRPKRLKNPETLETWRVFGIGVHPDDLSSYLVVGRQKRGSVSPRPAERTYLSKSVLEALLARLRIKSFEVVESTSDDGSRSIESFPPELKDVRIVRRSVDARRRKGSDPNYVYVLDVVLTKQSAADLRLTHQPGRLERLKSGDVVPGPDESVDGNEEATKPRVLIVGAGPAGLFCALHLARSGFKPIVLERGQPVEARGRSIGALIHRRSLDSESNFSFGEGGAGTWSDGKLTTRIGRNGGPVRHVLETLVKYGAPNRILVDGAPHLGTDNLIRLCMNMRQGLEAMGGEIHFGSRVSKFIVDGGSVKSVEVEMQEQSGESTATRTFHGDCGVVLATGHSARDMYYNLHDSGVTLEPKSFACGFRIEHPQSFINEKQYGRDWGPRALTKKASTDRANAEHFAQFDGAKSDQHKGTLPVASYRLATNEAWDGEANRGAFSFCMCPGGQIVPSSTEAEELCINGMSFSLRDSKWANSALVVTVDANDSILEGYRETHGPLAGLEFQREMERRAFAFGGRDLSAPVQRLTDFVSKKVSKSVPESSYRLGVKSAPLHDIYPKPLYNALVDAITTKFDAQMPGFLREDALLHGVETRTSSPVRIPRDTETLQALGVRDLYPCGEGAGYAGGIVSAAVDGLLVADAICKERYPSLKSSFFPQTDKVSGVGFDY